ncbi:hypothetical protein LIER_17224 [Lithospermum erythrorhizon]|uniref:Uncharacterized protein n=1 Tax=Lithospermum erythrorhizon TaxID=34254 RepID=A0AAV3Q9R0_LITER
MALKSMLNKETKNRTRSKQQSEIQILSTPKGLVLFHVGVGKAGWTLAVLIRWRLRYHRSCEVGGAVRWNIVELRWRAVGRWNVSGELCYHNSFLESLGIDFPTAVERIMCMFVGKQ